MEVGELWAYRARRHDQLTEVRVEAIGEKKPLRIKVKFIDDKFEGRIDWVPPSRLKCLWGEHERFEGTRAKWLELTSTYEGDTPQASAVQEVLRLFLSREIAGTRLRRRDDGILTVYQAERFEELVGTIESDIFIVNQEGQHYPWSVALDVAKRLARTHAIALAEYVRAREVANLGRAIPAGRGKYDQWLAESYRSEDISLDILRAWCGSEATDLSENLRLLKYENEWLQVVLDLAIGALSDAGDDRTAWSLQRAVHPDSDGKRWRAELARTTLRRKENLSTLRSATWQRVDRLQLGRRIHWGS